MPIRVNTGNANKLAEYRQFLGADIEATTVDIEEPDADVLTIIRYKASQFECVLVEDVSLEVEGFDVGAFVKWRLDRLIDTVGAKAAFHCWIGWHEQAKVSIFHGKVEGVMVPPRGQSFGFNPYFQPIGTKKTLAEDKADAVNARYWALQKFKARTPDLICEPLKIWTGAFQKA